MKWCSGLALALITMLGSPAARAGQTSDTSERGNRLIEEVAACRSISDTQQRLVCYDSTVARLVGATESRDILVVDREDVRRTRRSLFGFSLPQLPLFGRDGEEEEIRQVESTVSRAYRSGYNLFTLYLADGSVWQTVEALRRGDPVPGDAIRIRSAALGSYLANINGGTAVRIRRIQ